MTHIPVGTKLKVTEYIPLPQSRPPEADTVALQPEAHPVISAVGKLPEIISEKIQDLSVPFDIWSTPSEISHFWEYFLISAVVLLLVKSLADKYFAWKYRLKLNGTRY